MKEFVYSWMVMNEHLNVNNVAHGGYLTSACDKAAWFLATQTFNQSFMFKRISLVYDAPLFNGDMCFVKAHVKSVGKSSVKISITANAIRASNWQESLVGHGYIWMVAYNRDTGKACNLDNKIKGFNRTEDALASKK